MGDEANVPLYGLVDALPARVDPVVGPAVRCSRVLTDAPGGRQCPNQAVYVGIVMECCCGDRAGGNGVDGSPDDLDRFDEFHPTGVAEFVVYLCGTHGREQGWAMHFELMDMAFRGELHL